MPKNERFILFILAAMQFTHIMDFMIMMPLSKELCLRFSINPHQFTNLVSAYTFSAGTMGFLGVFFIDKFDRKNAILLAYLGFLVGTFACAIATTYAGLLSARIGAGACGGLISALVLSVVGDVVPEERRARGVGIVMLGFAFASIFGVPFGLFLANLYSWNMPFYFIGVTSIFIAFFAFVKLPSMRGHILESKIPNHLLLLMIFKNKNLVLTLFFNFFLIMGHFTIIPFLADYLESNVALSKNQVALMYTLGGIASVFTFPIVGKLADKYGKQKIFVIFATLTIFPILIITNLTKINVYLVFTITTIFFIFMGGRMIPATSILTSVVKRNIRGSFMSVRTSVQQFASSFSALVAGLIVVRNADGVLHNYSTAGIVAAITSIISILIVVKLKIVEDK